MESKKAYVVKWDNYASFPEEEERRMVAVFTDEKMAIEHCKKLQAKEDAHIKANEEDDGRPPYPQSYYGKFTYVELPLNPNS